MSGRNAAFLDRDGVINYDCGYIGRPENFKLLEGVPEALKLLISAGYVLVVVTNQSGIARGYYSEDDYRRVTARMEELLLAEGVVFAAVLHCPHGPESTCECRKPKPGMLIEGAAQVGASLATSVLFGDKASDIAAGRAAGIVHCFLVGAGEAEANGGTHADPNGRDLLACVQLLLA